MSRNGSGIYTKPAGTTAVSGADIESAKYNSTIDDLVEDANIARPIVAGGTGVATIALARDAFEIDAKIQDKATAYTAVAGDRSTLIRSTAALTLSLTAAATLGDGWFIDVRAETGTLTIDPDAAETIDGAATLDITVGNTARIRCNGTAFYSQFSTVDNSGIDNLVDDSTPQLGGPLDTNSQPVDFSQGVDVATATELLLLRDGNIFNLTGTTTVETIEDTANAWPIGSVVHCRADGVFQLTHHATNLILTSAANITTESGDWFTLQKYAAGDWRMMYYQRHDGSSLVLTSTGWEYTSADTTLTHADSQTFAHGLGAEPTHYEVNLKFIVAIQGYTIGDVIRNIDSFVNGGAGAVTLMVDNGSTTHVRLMTPISQTRILNKTTRNIYDLTGTDMSTNVRWVVKAKL